MLGKIGQGVDQLGRSIAQGATFGFGDEISAAGDAATHAVLGRGSDAGSFGERYDANLGCRASARMRRSRPRSPFQVRLPVALGRCWSVRQPLQLSGVMAPARKLIPGVPAALSAIGAGGEAVGNVLARIPGVAAVGNAVAPVVPIAAEGAAYGAAQGFGDGEGGFQNRLASAEVGAGTGAVLAPCCGWGHESRRCSRPGSQ